MSIGNERPGLPRQIHEEMHVEAPMRHIVAPIAYLGELDAVSEPSVLNVNHWKTQATAPVTVTNFEQGQHGQTIWIKGDGFTTVSHNANIKTNTEESKLLTSGRVYQFTNIEDVWYEATGGGSGGGSSVPGSGDIDIVGTAPINVSWAGSVATVSIDTSGIHVEWDNVDNKPATFPPSAHVHDWSDITTGVPTEFNPTVHALSGDRHSGTLADVQVIASNVTQHQAALSIGWSQLTSVPSTFTPSAHALNSATHTGLLGYVQLPDSAGTWHLTSGNLTIRTDLGAAFRYVTDDDIMRVQFAANVGASRIDINGPVGTSRGFFFMTSELIRWGINANTTLEPGSNVGSDIAISSYTDAGSFNFTAINILRNSGDVRLNTGNLSITSSKVLYFAGPNTAPWISYLSNGLNFRMHASVGQEFRFLNGAGSLLLQLTNTTLSLTGNIQASGTLALGGGVPLADRAIYVVNTVSGAAVLYALRFNATYSFAGAATMVGYYSAPTVAANVTGGSLFHMRADNMTLTTGAIVGNQYGLFINDLSGATDNWGVFVSSSTLRSYLGGGFGIADGANIAFGGLNTLPHISHTSNGFDLRGHTSVGTGFRFLNSIAAEVLTITDAGFVSAISTTVGGAQFAIYENNSATTGRGGELLLQHRNGSSGRVTYASIKGLAVTGGAGAEGGDMSLRVIKAGVLTEAIRIRSAGSIFIANAAVPLTDAGGWSLVPTASAFYLKSPTGSLRQIALT